MSANLPKRGALELFIVEITKNYFVIENLIFRF